MDFVSAKAAFSAVAAGTCIAGRGPQRLRSRGQRTKKTLQRAVVTSPTKTQTEQPGDFVLGMAWNSSMILFLWFFVYFLGVIGSYMGYSCVTLFSRIRIEVMCN